MVMKANATKSIPAGMFKAQCLQLMDEVKATGIPLIITKHGKPVAKLVTATPEVKPFRSLHGRSKGQIKILGDIVNPLPNEWKADRD